MGIGYIEVPASAIPPVPNKVFLSSPLGTVTCVSAASVTGSGVTNMTGFPRTAIVAIGGDENGNQHYLSTPYSGQVTGNVIGSNGFFASGTYQSGKSCAWMGRFDLALIGGNWEGWDDNGTYDRALLVDAIKQICHVTGYLPTKVIQYTILEADGNNDFPTMDTTIASEKWYLYTSAGETGSTQTGADGGPAHNYCVAWPNAVGSTPKDQSFSSHRTTATFDGSAEDYPQYAAAYFSELLFTRHSPVTTLVDGTIPASAYTDNRFSFHDAAKAPNLDGIFHDNMFIYPFYSGYYDTRNNYSNVWNSAVDPWLLRGSQHMFNRWHQIMGRCYSSRTYYRTGNFSDWVNLWCTDSSSKSVYSGATNGLAGYCDGGINESEWGKSWSDANYFPWESIIQAINANVNFCNSPQLVWTSAALSSLTDYATAVFVIASILMTNSYIAFEGPNGYRTDQAPWFDEFGGNPGTDIAKWWLGQPNGALPTAAAINGCWVRDFLHGTVIVNPPGNGTQTITNTQLNNYLHSSYSYRFFKGVQNPSLNTGNSMASVTLAASRGVLLRH